MMTIKNLIINLNTISTLTMFFLITFGTKNKSDINLRIKNTSKIITKEMKNALLKKQVQTKKSNDEWNDNFLTESSISFLSSKKVVKHKKLKNKKFSKIPNKYNENVSDITQFKKKNLAEEDNAKTLNYNNSSDTASVTTFETILPHEKKIMKKKIEANDMANPVLDSNSISKIKSFTCFINTPQIDFIQIKGNIILIYYIGLVFKQLRTSFYLYLIGSILSEVNSIFNRKLDYNILEALSITELKKLQVCLNFIKLYLDTLHEYIKIKKIEFSSFLYYQHKTEELLNYEIDIYTNIYEFFLIVEKSRPLVLLYYKAIQICINKKKLNFFKEEKLDNASFETFKTYIIVLNNASESEYKKLEIEFMHIYSNYDDSININEFNILNLNEFDLSIENLYTVSNFIKYKNFKIFYINIYTFINLISPISLYKKNSKKSFNDAFIDYNSDPKILFKLLQVYQQKIYIIADKNPQTEYLNEKKFKELENLILDLITNKSLYEKVLDMIKMTIDESDLKNLPKDDILRLIKYSKEKLKCVEYAFFLFNNNSIYKKYFESCFSALNKDLMV